MRVIEFKGKREDGKGWVYGYYTLEFERGYNSQGIDDVPPRVGYMLGNREYHEVIQSTVGLYTGLVDARNDRTYEFDKVLSYTFGEGVVRWEEDSATFYLDFGGEDWNTNMSHLTECILIGNIHD